MLNIKILLDKSKLVEVGQPRGEVHDVLGAPKSKWAKSSNLDFWRTNIWLGGLAIDIFYSGQHCKYSKHELSSTECKVLNVKYWK